MDSRYRYCNFNGSYKSYSVPTKSSAPIYTMCGSQTKGAQLFMNSPTISTATKFQFVPVQNFVTSTNSNNNNNNSSENMGNFNSTIIPILNSIKGFFTNLIRSNSNTDKIGDTPCKYLSAQSSNNRTSICKDKSCVEYESFIDLGILADISSLSSSTKTFSDIDLQKNTSIEMPTKDKEVDRIVEQISPNITKEISFEAASFDTDTNEAVQNHCFVNKKNKRSKSPTIYSKETWNDHNKSSSFCKTNVKNINKNKKEKLKNELAWNIHADMDDDAVNEWDDENDFTTVIRYAQMAQSNHDTILSNSKFQCFSKEDFPLIQSKTNPAVAFPKTESCILYKKQRKLSECDSEDSFIVFSNDSPHSTPSSMESQSSFTICDRVRQIFPQTKARQRHVSESSDDYICFLDETDENERIECSYSWDSDTDDEDISTETNQPDSGIEEKKVRFNLNVEIHEMHVWTFAYQQARKGTWEQIGRDRVRFHDRIIRSEIFLNPILSSVHREKIYNERFHI